MRRHVLNHSQPALPFPLGDVIIPGSESVNPSRESMFPTQPDPVKIENKPKMSDACVKACDTCRLFMLCKDLEFHQNRQALETPDDDRSCPLSAILGIDVLSFSQWRQKLIIRLRVIKEKRAREADIQFQMENSGPIDSSSL
jgi:hypothetical protein